jgi:diaminobutyrate-2-oxoglutarate transaminase
VFTRGEGSVLYDESGERYLDFLSGAGSLNYGHNDPALRQSLLDYVEGNGILHGLDMATEAKREFLETFERIILKPRGMHYKVQFTGPTGTNAVEAALKLARRVTGRTNIVSFTNAFHGVTLGSLAVTGNVHYRHAAGVPLGNATFMPYDGYLGPHVSTIDYLEQCLNDRSSGLEMPAAVIVETVQGEGGLHTAGVAWLKHLQRLCTDQGVLLIVDDIQAGCGRTGTFFSFESAGIRPDFVTLSKSLSGYGLPMSVLLMKPEYDAWEPGEHNGTFRGNNLAFVTATAALRHYWSSNDFQLDIKHKAALLRGRLLSMAGPPAGAGLRGRGLIQGLVCEPASAAAEICRASFERGLIIETSGAESEVVKCLPPLNIPDGELWAGLDLLESAVKEIRGRSRETLVQAVGAEK